MDKQMTFDEYCKKNQHSRNCTRLEAFSMGQRSRQAEIDDLQLELSRAKHVYNNVVEMELKKNQEKDKRIESQSNCIENLVVQKSIYLDKVTKAIAHLDSFDHSKADRNKILRSIESALEALRGDNA